MFRHSRSLARPCLALFTMLLASAAASAQPLAFPGAEGAGKHTTGGRGGEVYYVTDLTDPYGDLIEGTLRHAIETANGPRTIVFDVGGTINLTSQLRMRHKSDITIAGQTAPGGGITVADHEFWISDSQNIIVQHMRFAAGDALAPKDDPNYVPDYDPIAGPRSFRIWNAQDVIVDHVTARWGTEDNLGVSTSSRNVTIQNSFITEGLHYADHDKGERGYGAVINGHEISFINNLLAQNRSRNPRVGVRDDQDGDTTLEFANNVLYRARNDFGGFGAEAFNPGDITIKANYVGNVAIHGPGVGNGPQSMVNGFGPSDPQYSPLVYFDGNFYDRDTSRPLDFDGPSGPLHHNGVIEVDTPFDMFDYEATSARQAYINVLSFAGSAHTRDEHDRRMLRDVMERGLLGRSAGHIDRPSDVGGYPEIDPGTTPVSTARDGIPDWWKQAHGLDVNQSYHQTDAGDGYTYLEHYLHSVNEPYRPHTDTMPMVISTAFGRGADAQISENTADGDASATSGGNSTDAELNARFMGSGGDRNEKILLRFDLADVVTGSVADAALELTAFRNMGNDTLRVYALEHHAPDQRWDDENIEFANAPGVAFDGNSETRGLELDDLLLLGEFNTAGYGEGDVITFDHPNLAVFLNLLMERDPDADDATMVTLLIDRESTGSGQSRFASSNATHLQSGDAGDFDAGTFAPRLVLDATLVPEPASLGMLGGGLAVLLLRRAGVR